MYVIEFDLINPATGQPSSLVVGLSWEVTNGVEIDLDASIIVLDANYRCVDIVSFSKLRSSDGAIVHGGDEREGDAKGDDEKIFVCLPNVHPAATILGVVINSYSGQELDDVSKCGCRLFDPQTVYQTGPLCQLNFSNAAFLNGKTACLVAMLYRNPNDASDWLMRAIGEGAHGDTADDNVDELQAALRRAPPMAKPPSAPRPVPVATPLVAVAVAVPAMPANMPMMPPAAPGLMMPAI